MSAKSKPVLACTALVTAFAAFAVLPAHADDAAQCQANQGTFVTGTVSGTPQFAASRSKRHGYPLSHTRLYVQTAGGSKLEVDIDNVFAAGYSKKRSIPSGLQAIADGTKLELCGQSYSDPNGKNGIHWVHTNCGAKPTSRRPDGWVKIVAADGSVGPNLEGDQDLCNIFN
ncbi:MAG TPA: hypothetical protein VF798_07595 [Burkholderiaceae bacterium]